MKNTSILGSSVHRDVKTASSYERFKIVNVDNCGTERDKRSKHAKNNSLNYFAGPNFLFAHQLPQSFTNAEEILQ